MRGIVGTLVMVAMAAAAGGFPAGGSRAAGWAATNGMAIVDFSYAPQTITVAPGDTVLWTNGGREPHTVRAGFPLGAGGFSSGAIAPGSSFSQRFPEAGVFDYLCEFHPQMRGAVVVAAPGVSPAAAAPVLPAAGAAARPSLPLLAGAGAALALAGVLVARRRAAAPR